MTRYCLLLLTALAGAAAGSSVLAQQTPALTPTPTTTLNPFSKPDLLKQKPQRLPERSRAAGPVEEPEEPEFSLSATLISVNTPMALINGKLIEQDQEVDGIHLLLVDEDSVKIRYHNRIYRVFIEQDDLGQGEDVPLINLQGTL